MSVFNGAEFIKQAVRSVLTQKGVLLELIVVDDGSKDDTSDILDTFNDPRIIRDSFPANRGKAAAFNRAFERSSGRMIALLAADDIIEPDSLRLRFDALEEGAPAAYHGLLPCDSEMHPLAEPRGGNDLDIDGHLHRTLRYNPVSGGTLMLRRDVASRGFPIPETLPFEDWWLTIAALVFGGSISWVDGPVTCYRLHENNTIGTLHPRLDPKVLERDQRRHLAFYDALEKTVDVWPLKPVERADIKRRIRINHQLVKAMAEGQRLWPTSELIGATGAFKWLLLTLLTVPTARAHWRLIVGALSAPRPLVLKIVEHMRTFGMKDNGYTG